MVQRSRGAPGLAGGLQHLYCFNNNNDDDDDEDEDDARCFLTLILS